MASSFRHLSSRLVVSAPLRRQALTRGMRTSAPANAAANLNMPALSPTMTEGTISSWKVKEGDEFSAGDVLLEIETDKAQMDVEAQDDGIMAKIIVKAGTKAVQVGTRIGVLAEQGDEISTLEIPAEDGSGPGPQATDTQSSKKDTTSPPPEGRLTKVESSAKSTPETVHKHAAPKAPHTPSPSVAHLLRSHGVPKEDVVKIAATGPKGRLLKGDVLAFLGKIEKTWPKELENRIHKGENLDLSNIKIAPPKKAEAKKPVEEKKKAPEPPRDAELKIEVSFSEVLKVQNKLQATLGVHLPLSSFITKATTKANQHLPPSSLPPTVSDLFDEILGLPATSPKATHGSFTPQITALPSSSFAHSAPSAEIDIIDILAGALQAAPAAKSLPPSAGIAATGPNVISLTVPVVEEKRARVFLERVKVYLEKDPGSLVL